MRPKSRCLRLTSFYLVCGAICAARGQDLHGSITGHTYADDKIRVTAPATWAIAIDHEQRSGAILHKGKYILRLCTSCMQTSGIVGGRFNEIAGLVQPFAMRVDPLAQPDACGQGRSTRISEQLHRIDFWFQRDSAHLYSEGTDDCPQPKTMARLWYGSYFAENCAHSAEGEDCGGNFLHLNWLTGQDARETPTDEMVIALTCDVTDLDQLPHKGDPELNRVLIEASNIVRSVSFKRRTAD